MGSARDISPNPTRVRGSAHLPVPTCPRLQHTDCHAFYYAFTPYPLEGGFDSRTVQEVIGPKDVIGTTIHAHLIPRRQKGRPGAAAPSTPSR
jgi:hypothetical protein